MELVELDGHSRHGKPAASSGCCIKRQCIFRKVKRGQAAAFDMALREMQFGTTQYQFLFIWLLMHKS